MQATYDGIGAGGSDALLRNQLDLMVSTINELDLNGTSDGSDGVVNECGVVLQVASALEESESSIRRGIKGVGDKELRESSIRRGIESLPSSIPSRSPSSIRRGIESLPSSIPSRSPSSIRRGIKSLPSLGLFDPVNWGVGDEMDRTELQSGGLLLGASNSRGGLLGASHLGASHLGASNLGASNSRGGLLGASNLGASNLGASNSIGATSGEEALRLTSESELGDVYMMMRGAEERRRMAEDESIKLKAEEEVRLNEHGESQKVVFYIVIERLLQASLNSLSPTPSTL